ncbi:MAG: glycosyltransferase family 39 protein [Patescibacteria group bacterium]|nr:glycosyltransferase family 39 protein [Patescibacteria group bacterium]
MTSNRKIARLIYLLLFTIILWEGLLIFHDINKNDIFHDEKWHVQVIESLKHGEGFKKWNFLSGESEKRYRRGLFLNSSTYLTTKTFGQNNFTLRLIPAIFGVLLIPVIFFSLRKIIGNIPALLTSIGFAFSPPAVFLARFLRPYTTFLAFYLLSFYFSYLFLVLIKNDRNKKALAMCLSLLLVSVTGAIQANQTSKILLLLIPVSWIFSMIINKNILKNTIKKRNALLTLGFLFFASVIILEITGITNISITGKQFLNHLSYENIKNPEKTYYQYLFSKYTKFPFLMYLSFSVGTFFLLWRSFLKKDFGAFHLLLFTFVPLFFVIYLLNRYEDFRYCYFLIPFIYSIAMLGLYSIVENITKALSKKRNKAIPAFISIFLALLFVFYPLLPIKEIQGLTKESPSVWSDDYGKTELHRRAIAPEYSKIYQHINKNQKDGDFVITDSGEYYLQTNPRVTYFLLRRKSKELTNEKTKKSIDFFELMSKKQGESYLVTTYAHLLDRDLLDYLMENCENISKDLGVKKYNYVGWYENKNLFWPNLFYCK